MKQAKENPQDKAARLRERRSAELERSRTVQTQARDLTGDVRRIYGNRVTMFGLARPMAPRPIAPRPSPTQSNSIFGGNRD